MNGKRGLGRVISALLAASSMIGGASAAPKKKVQRPNSAGVVIDGGSSERGRERLAGRPRAKSAPPFLKNSKTYYLGIPGLIGTAGIGYGLYHLLSKGEKKKEDKAGEKSGGGSSLDFVEKEDIKKLSECGLIDYLKRFKFTGFSMKSGMSVNWNSFSDDDDGNRRFDCIDFAIGVGDKWKDNAYISRVNFSTSGGVVQLDLSKDDGKGETNWLRVNFQFVGAENLYFNYESEKNPIENYANAIAEGAFFQSISALFAEKVWDRNYLFKEFRGCKNCLDFVKKKYKNNDVYNANKDKVLKLFEGCKILEKYLCEVLKNEEKNMQSAKK